MPWWISCTILSDAMDDDRLKQLRIKIDAIDQQILQLISERGRCAQAVARVKGETDPAAVFYRPEREAQVLRRIMQSNQGPLSDEQMARLFREIMSACLALEEPLSVTFPGAEGSFAEQAAIRHFGHCARCQPVASIAEVFAQVAAGTVSYGVVPVESASEGVVWGTLESFLDFALISCGEVVLPTHYQLLAANRNPEHITRIYAHAHALAQCCQWLDHHWPGVERVVLSAGDRGYRRVRQEPGSAVIVGLHATGTDKLKIVAKNIEDHPDSWTRYLIVGSQPVPPSGADKTSVLLSMSDQPGTLRALLASFHQHHIDLSRVATRPLPSGLCRSLLFIDFDGHQDDAAVRAVLDQLGQQADDCRVLGSYPTGVL